MTAILMSVFTVYGSLIWFRRTGPSFFVRSLIAQSYFTDVGCRPTSNARMYLIASQSANCSAFLRSYCLKVVLFLALFFSFSFWSFSRLTAEFTAWSRGIEEKLRENVRIGNEAGAIAALDIGVVDVLEILQLLQWNSW